MLYIFILFLVILLSIIYKIFNKEILSPSFLVCLIFIFSTAVLIIYQEEWGLELSIKAVFIFLIGILAIISGEMTARKIKIGRKKTLFRNEEVLCPIKVNKFLLYFCMAFVIITSVLFYRETMELATNSGITTHYILLTVNLTKLIEGSEVSYLVKQMTTISKSISCIIVYIYVYNLIFFKYIEKNVAFYIIVIAYLLMTLLTGGRTNLIHHILYILFVALILRAKKNRWKSNSNYKFVIRLLLVVVAIVLLFYYAGNLTGKSNHIKILDYFAEYFSSGVYAFNYFIEHSLYSSDSNFYGIHTFSGIYSILRTLGFNIPESVVSLEYVTCGNYMTNIYTPFRRYYQDFGIIGIRIIFYITAFMYTKILMSNKKINSSGLCCIFTAVFYYPLFFITVEERIFMEVLSASTVYQIIYILILYKFLVMTSIKNNMKRDFTRDMQVVKNGNKIYPGTTENTFLLGYENIT